MIFRGVWDFQDERAEVDKSEMAISFNCIDCIVNFPVEFALPCGYQHLHKIPATNQKKARQRKNQPFLSMDGCCCYVFPLRPLGLIYVALMKCMKRWRACGWLGAWVVGWSWVELGGVGQWFMPTAEGRTPSCAQRTANKVKVISQKRVALFVSQLFRDSDMAFALPRWETGNSHLTTIWLQLTAVELNLKPNK